MDKHQYASFRDFFLKILLLGGRRAGKSAFTHRYSSGAFEGKEATYDDDDFKLVIKEVNGIFLKLKIWDIPFMEKFRVLRREYFYSVQGLAIIMDLTNPESFENVLYWKNEIDTNFLDKIPEIILIGNKTDLESERCFSYEEAKMRADSLGMLYIETSAKMNCNVQKALEILLINIMNSYCESE